MKKIKCYGTTKIGPKGQVVIPSGLRKEMKIKTGDQFIVFKNDHMESIVILKTNDITKMLKHITDELATLEKSLNQ